MELPDEIVPGKERMEAEAPLRRSEGVLPEVPCPPRHRHHHSPQGRPWGAYWHGDLGKLEGCKVSDLDRIRRIRISVEIFLVLTKFSTNFA